MLRKTVLITLFLPFAQYIFIYAKSKAERLPINC